MKEQIIKAIQSQHIIRISFQKETTGEYVTRDIMPYDIFPQKKKGSWYEEDYLLGYSDYHLNHKPHPVATYLSNIRNIEVLLETFNGSEIIQILKPKQPPVVNRDW